VSSCNRPTKTISFVVSLVALIGGCGDSTSPAADAPYALAVISDGGSPVRVVDFKGAVIAEFSCSPNCTYQVARWSRDGSKLALTASAVENGAPQSILYTANADGTSPVRIATSPESCVYYHSNCVIYHHPFDPDWSADGQLVYTLNDTSVVVAAPNGSGTKVLFSTPDGVQQARWGPADQTITFVRRSNAFLHSLQSADGSGVRALGNREVSRYSWSPDGLSIAVIAFVPDGTTFLGLMNPITGQATELVRHTINGFAWSPSGNEIAFSDADTLFVVDRQGAVMRVAQGGLQMPWWSPDGRYLVVENTNYPASIVAISRTTGQSREVFNGGLTMRFAVTSTGQWTGYSLY
jgi:Tol biopolymer transport system component